MVNERKPEEKVQNAATAQPSGQRDLEQVFRQHAPRVLSAALRVTGNSQDAEDVVQTVFLRLVRREAHLTEDPGAYLHRAGVNAALDILRSRRAARASTLDTPGLSTAEVQEPDPERAASSAEIRERIRTALGSLNPRSAEIFILRYFEGYDNHEIARILGSSKSTVAVTLHRTRAHLRDAIRPLIEHPRGDRP